MRDKASMEAEIGCRQARRRFTALDEDAASASISIAERDAAKRHVQTCSRCGTEYRLFALRRAALDAAASQPITPDEHFFVALRARIARGPEPSTSRPSDESWAAALLATARQLVPAMAVLLLLMVGATLLWNQAPPESSPVTNQAAVRPRERVVFPDMYDYPEPTRDDVLETLVAVEEKENGK